MKPKEPTKEQLEERKKKAIERLLASRVSHPPAKINEEELANLRRQGWTYPELAKHFGVNKTTIVTRIKRLKNKGITLSVEGQQDQIYTTLNRIREAVNQQFKMLDTELKKKEISAEDRRLTLKFLLDTSAEIRAQEKLVVDIAKTIYEIRTKEVYESVIGVILDAVNAESCATCRERISNRIREAGNLERGVREITEARVASPFSS